MWWQHGHQLQLCSIFIIFSLVTSHKRSKICNFLPMVAKIINHYRTEQQITKNWQACNSRHIDYRQNFSLKNCFLPDYSSHEFSNLETILWTVWAFYTQTYLKRLYINSYLILNYLLLFINNCCFIGWDIFSGYLRGKKCYQCRQTYIPFMHFRLHYWLMDTKLMMISNHPTYLKLVFMI